MALHRLGFALAMTMVLLGGCGSQKPSGRSTARTVVDALPATTATADVDRRATLALKQSLLNSFPQNSSGAMVETGLVKDGFSCGPNPAAPRERACLRALREGACEVNTIVRSTPYAPEKAQVIKICEVGGAPTKPN